MLKNILILISLALMALTATSYAEQYICIADEAAGFSYKGNLKAWKGTTFRTENKYIITKDAADINSYAVKEHGEEFISYGCNDGFNKYGWLNCVGLGGEFKFNKNSMRYITTYLIGYTDGADNNDNTPNMEIGKCTSF